MIYLTLIFSIVAVLLTAWLCFIFARAAKEWRQAERQLRSDVRFLYQDRERVIRTLTDHMHRLRVQEDRAVAVGPTWTTGIGTRLRIRDMTDCHLRNALAWSEQHGKDTTDLRAELKLRRRNKRMEAQQ